MMDFLYDSTPVFNADTSVQGGADVHPMPAGITPGLKLNTDFSSDLTGRISIAAIQLVVVAGVLLYIWTRNVQGGG